VHAHAVQPAIAKKRRIRQTIGQLFSTVSALPRNSNDGQVRSFHQQLCTTAQA
jgi:hypothetical protein